MTVKFILKAPIEIEMLISIISIDEPTRVGTVTFGLGVGNYPTPEKMKAALEKFEAEEMPDGFRLMDKREYFDKLIREKTGSSERFALPGGLDWDA